MVFLKSVFLIGCCGTGDRQGDVFLRFELGSVNGFWRYRVGKRCSLG